MYVYVNVWMYMYMYMHVYLYNYSPEDQASLPPSLCSGEQPEMLFRVPVLLFPPREPDSQS